MPATDVNANIVRFWDSETTPKIFSYAKNSDIKEDAIFDLMKLKQGWNFGDGDKISTDAIFEAINIYGKVKIYNLSLEVHPLLEGGVNLLFYNEDNFLDIFISVNKSISLKQEKGFGYEYELIYEKENAEESDLFDRLNNISTTKFIKCISLEPYMYGITAQQRVDSKVTHFQTTTEEFPFLITNVQSSQRQSEFAHIFQYSTSEPLVFQ